MTSTSTTSASPRIALAAGGTGGHIMPALALADALRDLSPDVQLLFFSGQKEQEIRWYDQAGVTPIQLPAAPIRRGLAGKLRSAFATLKAVNLARHELKKFRPDCVVGLGSYVAGSTILASMSLRIPFAIHEQNSLPGKANRYLAPRAALVATTYPKAFQGSAIKKLAVTGNPLRKKVIEFVEPAIARSHFQLDDRRRTLLVSGASQGARGINLALLELLRRFSSPAELDWQVLWITGAAQYEPVAAQVANLPCASAIRLFPFVQEMGMAYASADIAVCRASSSSLAEPAAWGLPMIAIPFPYSAEDHQRHNAEYFARSGACVVIDERELTPERLLTAVTSILGDEKVYRDMSQAARSLARPDAAHDLARAVLELAQQH